MQEFAAPTPLRHGSGPVPWGYVASIVSSGTLVVALAWLSAGWIADLLAAPAVVAFDRNVIEAIRGYASPASIEALTWVSRIHSNAGILAFSAMTAAWLASHGQSTRLWPLLATAPGGLLLNSTVKMAIQRARPGADYAVERLTSFSFPSGHTASTTCLYGFLLLLVWRMSDKPACRITAAAFAVAVVGLVAASRIMLGSHYPSDCAAAVVEGIAWLVLCAVAARRLAQ